MVHLDIKKHTPELVIIKNVTYVQPIPLSLRVDNLCFSHGVLLPWIQPSLFKKKKPEIVFN